MAEDNIPVESETNPEKRNNENNQLLLNLNNERERILI